MKIHIVTYHTTTFKQTEGVFKTFKDAENFANILRDEIMTDGDFSSYVTVEAFDVIGA